MSSFQARRRKFNRKNNTNLTTAEFGRLLRKQARLKSHPIPGLQTLEIPELSAEAMDLVRRIMEEELDSDSGSDDVLDEDA